MAADVAITEITDVDVAATIIAVMAFLAATTIAASGSLSYCSSAVAITTIVVVAATMAVVMVSLAATTTAANGLSGSSCFPASAETIMAAANPF